MPTYQYRCKKCGEEFEKTQSFSDETTPACPACRTRSKKNVVKVFGAVGISFKGSGFYKNDSSTSKSGSKSSDSGSSSESSPGGTKTAEKTGSESSSTNGSKSTDSAAKSSSAD